MHYYLFLDDIREPKQVGALPPRAWTVVRSYAAFTNTITRCGLPLFISFDHDLGAEHYADINKAAGGGTLATHKIDYDSMQEKTGYHCAQWLVGYCLDHKLPLPPYMIHSFNPVGAANIKGLLEGFNAR